MNMTEHCEDPDCTCRSEYAFSDPHTTGLVCGMGMAIAENVHDSSPGIYWSIQAQRLRDGITLNSATEDDFVIEDHHFVIEIDALVQCVARMHSQLGPDFSRAVLLAVPRSPEMQAKYEEFARKVDDLIPGPE